MHKKIMLVSLFMFLSTNHSIMLLGKNKKNKHSKNITNVIKNNVNRNIDSIDSFMDYELPKPKLDENPSAFKFWFRRIGILLLNKFLQTQSWVSNKYNSIVK